MKDEFNCMSEGSNIPAVPFPDEVTSGYLYNEEGYNFFPNDQIEIRDEETNDKTELYEILSIRDQEELKVYKYMAEEFESMGVDEVNQLLEKENAYRWFILYREEVPIKGHPSMESIVFYVYGIESPFIEGSNLALLFLWASSNSYPSKTMPDVEEIVEAPTFEKLQENLLEKSGRLEKLYTEMEGSVEEDVGLIATFGEFNARKRFDVDEPRTYDEETRQRIKEKAAKLETHLKENENIYV